MKEKLSKIRSEALEQIHAENADLEQIKIKYLGKKGELTAVLRGMGALSAEERPVVGQLANEVRADIEAAIKEKLQAEQAKQLEEKLKAEVGVVNGLAWTMFGGDVLKVEAGVVSGAGKVDVTGNLGEVMKESVN